jgi:ATP-dependent Clp protease ATP-binding subunit ClpC
MATEVHYCERHHRPAVAQRVRTLPDGTQEVEYLCELDLAEQRLSRGFGRSSLFDDFFSDFFSEPSSETARRPAATRQVERVDVTEFFSDATRELLQRAARTALDWGSLDLDSDHLLHAALEDNVVRHICGCSPGWCARTGRGALPRDSPVP